MTKRVIVTHIDPDDWRLKPEQGPDETREEWKARNFVRHYSSGPTTFRAKNFHIQSAAAAEMKLECPPGFVQFQDECVPEAGE